MSRAGKGSIESRGQESRRVRRTMENKEGGSTDLVDKSYDMNA